MALRSERNTLTRGEFSFPDRGKGGGATVRKRSKCRHHPLGADAVDPAPQFATATSAHLIPIDSIDGDDLGWVHSSGQGD
jgi:hypothetical protein